MSPPAQRLILEATVDRSLIRGTLTAASGGRRDFHGWLELTTAIEAMLTSEEPDELDTPPRRRD